MHAIGYYRRMQLSFRKRRLKVCTSVPATLAELNEGEHGIVESLELPAGDAQRLMELGFLPGSRVDAARCAPGGDPRIFRIDGSEIALRRELSSRLTLRRIL